MTDEPIAPEPTASPSPTPAPSPAPTPYTIPEAYKEKPWASTIKSEEDLWKQLDGAQGLIGKKFLVPDFDKATPKEIEDYFAQGRPKDENAYTFSEETGDEEKKFYSGVFSKYGLHPFVANQIIKDVQAQQKAQFEGMFDADTYKAEMEKSFGSSYEKATGAITKILDGNLNKEDKALLEKLPNSMLALVYRAVDNITKAYGVSETSAAAGKGAAPSQEDKMALRKDIRKQITELSKNPWHTVEQKNELLKKLEATYA